MNRKTIKKVLEKMHKEFCATIMDEKVRKLVKNRSINWSGCSILL